MAYQLTQTFYWLLLATWFGGLLFIALAAPVIFRTVRNAKPILPDILSVNLEGQHGTLLSGMIVGALLNRLAHVQLICAAVLLPLFIVQARIINLEGSHFTAALIRWALYVVAVALVLYEWRVRWPRILKLRTEYIEHADEPEIANPAREKFGREHKGSVMILQMLLCLLLGIVLFSATIAPRAMAYVPSAAGSAR